jgi:hypothetical protein
MQFNNYTPFAGDAWENVDSENRRYVTAVARARFLLREGSVPGALELVPDPDQGELFGEDLFYGERGRSSVRYESDYVPFKAHTDVVLNADAAAPGGRARSFWECGVRIYAKNGDLLKSYGLEVRGEKRYLKAGAAWLPGVREKAVRVPVRYERAKGGTVMLKEEEGGERCLKIDPYNPVGCGMKKLRDPEGTVFAPQVVYLDTPEAKRVPPGFGFINRAWESRTEYAGTYDEAWLENQHPLPPRDFDLRYRQAAHPELVMEGHLKGGCRFELLHLLEGEAVHAFTLPELTLLSRLRTHTGEFYAKMNLDTLVVDIGGEAKEEHRVYVSWRAQLPTALEADAAEIMLIGEGDNG